MYSFIYLSIYLFIQTFFGLFSYWYKLKLVNIFLETSPKHQGHSKEQEYRVKSLRTVRLCKASFNDTRCRFFLWYFCSWCLFYSFRHIINTLALPLSLRTSSYPCRLLDFFLAFHSFISSSFSRSTPEYLNVTWLTHNVVSFSAQVQIPSSLRSIKKKVE